MPRDNLAFALDYPSLAEAREPLRLLAPYVGIAKVGLELFTREGPEAVRAVRSSGIDVFLDLKLHDIPETVERAVASAAELGARFLTVHCCGGRSMLKRAVARAGADLTILGVTVLTSLDISDLLSIGVAATPEEQVLRMAHLGWDAGLRAFVCSPREVAALRAAFPDATLVTPGIRPAGADVHDQKRAATPADAIRAGADILVVGRPIRDAASPPQLAASIVDEIDAALACRTGSQS